MFLWELTKRCLQFSSEDEFAVPQLSRQAQKEITQQLIKDGYNLDLEPDDEDLDLIPPRPLQDRCVCCNMHLTCAIQWPWTSQELWANRCLFVN